MTYRPGLPPVPDRMQFLPIDRGYPVPWFVYFVNGRPDFRVVRPNGHSIAIRKHLCWICGGPLGRNLAFTIGPMCTINRISAEPPAHRECAVFAATACPFLSRPTMERGVAPMPGEVTIDPAHCPENPGVAVVWITRRFGVEPRGNGAPLCKLGPAIEVLWFHKGEPAPYAVAEAALRTGGRRILEVAQREGADLEDVVRRINAAREFLPSEGRPPVKLVEVASLAPELPVGFYDHDPATR